MANESLGSSSLIITIFTTHIWRAHALLLKLALIHPEIGIVLLPLIHPWVPTRSERMCEWTVIGKCQPFANFKWDQSASLFGEEILLKMGIIIRWTPGSSYRSIYCCFRIFYSAINVMSLRLALSKTIINYHQTVTCPSKLQRTAAADAVSPPSHRYADIEGRIRADEFLGWEKPDAEEVKQRITGRLSKKGRKPLRPERTLRNQQSLANTQF